MASGCHRQTDEQRQHMHKHTHTPTHTHTHTQTHTHTHTLTQDISVPRFPCIDKANYSPCDNASYGSVL